MRDFKELKVWHKAHPFTLDVYRQTKGFPPDERFGFDLPASQGRLVSAFDYRRRLWPIGRS